MDRQLQMLALPQEVCRHMLTWVAAPAALGGISRQWRALLADAWYREHAERRRWRQLRGSLTQLLPYEALTEVLRWGPPQLQEAVDHFAGSLETRYTRWILFTYWSTDLWGEATLGGAVLPEGVRSVLASFSVGDTKLALCAHMGPCENVVTWWEFTRFWQPHGASFAASCLPALEAACYRAMTAEQRAFGCCVERCLFW